MRLFLLTLFCVGLIGCGQSGPLYLPKPKPMKTKVVKATHQTVQHPTHS